MKTKYHYILSIVILLLVSNISSKAQNPRTEWFEQARYGMFVHWGLYSAAEGMWKGEGLRYLNNYAEWIRYRNRISKEEYGQLAKRFDWNNINPEEWVLLAKKAGMKYIIVTAKHHDGVAIWDTKIGDYSLPKLSGKGRDIIKEIAKACRTHGMKLGFYYSHWIDWEHPYGWDHNHELTGELTNEQFDEYWQQKALPQLRELLTNYGDISIMWFDMWLPYQNSIFKKEQLEQAATLIRKLQPNCIINSRLGLPTDSKYVDFETLGDNQFGTSYTDHPWETPGTIAHSWGYNGIETGWKSTTQLLKALISNVALNGGFTLNIGPRANGDIPTEGISRLETIGSWLNRHGEAVYDNTGLGLKVNQHDWGLITKKQNSSTVYFHVFNWPLDSVLRVTGINSTPTDIEILNATGNEPLRFTQEGPLLHIHLPSRQADPYVSIIRVSYNTVELDPNIVAESTFGGFSLQPNNIITPKGIHIIKYDGTRPEHFLARDEDITWEVYIGEPGNYRVDFSAHNPGTQPVIAHVDFAQQTLSAPIKPNGKVVNEPNEENYTDEFVDNHLGKVYIKTPGRYRIKFTTESEEPIWFNRLWIENTRSDEKL